MTKNILITGADGFIGKNLYHQISSLNKYSILKFTEENDNNDLLEMLKKADIIYHLAGSNRPEEVSEYKEINFGLTNTIIQYLKEINRTPKIVFSSSIQALNDNPYGKSKKMAEDALIRFAETKKSEVHIYRLLNVFGKWCMPNYNSVVATFCHNIANNLPIAIHNPSSQLNLIYIDDVVNEFIQHLEKDIPDKSIFKEINNMFTVSLEELANKIYSFNSIRDNLTLPDFSDLFTKYLYTTYLSYLPKNNFNYTLKEYKDERGKLVELIKSQNFGQIFVSTTKPGIIRGNHFHHTKVEKFIVIKGMAIIRFRKIDSNEVISYTVSDAPIQVVDIPPGYTHSIENIGEGEMIVLFWANEVFNPQIPDTFALQVLTDETT